MNYSNVEKLRKNASMESVVKAARLDANNLWRKYYNFKEQQDMEGTIQLGDNLYKLERLLDDAGKQEALVSHLERLTAKI